MGHTCRQQWQSGSGAAARRRAVEWQGFKVDGGCAYGLPTRSWQTAAGGGVSASTSVEVASRARAHGSHAKRTRAPEEQCHRSSEKFPRVLAAAAPPGPCVGGSADSGPQRTGTCSAARRQEPADRRLQAGQNKAGGLPPTRTRNRLGSWAEPRPLPRPQTPGTTTGRPPDDLHGSPRPTPKRQTKAQSSL